MKERFILAPGAYNTDLIRSLALHGHGSFGMRIYTSAYALASDLLVRKGVLVSNVVTDTEARYIINNSIKTISAFKNVSFTDAVNVAGSLKTLRCLITSDEDSQMQRLISESGFADKNKNLLEAYDNYRKAIAGRMDQIDVIREALSQEFDFEAEYIMLKEFPLLPLEEKLLKHASKDSVLKMTLMDLLGVQKQPLNDISYIKAYGNSNEVEDVLNYIFEKNIPLDDCVVAVTSTTKYNQLFLEYSQKHDFNVLFANGIAINNTNPARLLRLYYQWDVNGYHGVDSLMNMLYSSCFNMEKLTGSFSEQVSYSVIKNTIDRAGQLKLSPDLNINQNKVDEYISLIDEEERIDSEFLKVLANELGRTCVSFISEYAVIRDERDEEALRVLTRDITEYLEKCPEGNYSDIIEVLLSKNVGRSVSKPSNLLVTDIRGALSVLRRHLFVIGLSANNYPGTVKENYLLLDDDMELYGKGVPTSKTMIERKKDDLKNLMSVYSSIGSEIRLYYSSYDLTGIKKENASSILYEIYQEQNPSGTMKEFNELLDKSATSYLGNRISLSHQVLNSVNSSQIIPLVLNQHCAVSYDGDRSFSPSALESFFKCQRRFYLQFILEIEEPDPDDPLEVIDARDMGTLVHLIMEQLAKNSGLSEDEFMAFAENKYDEFLKKRIPLNDESAKAARRQFLDMALKGYRNSPKNEVVLAEKKLYVRHKESGITIKGLPDSVEKDKDGKYLIADYKTKRNYEHEENDIDTCLQVVLYAYMMKHSKMALDIAYCTYRYLRYSKPVNCEYNKTVEEKLAKRLCKVKDALDSGEFPCTDDKDNCTYCKFASICGKKLENEVTEDE